MQFAFQDGRRILECVDHLWNAVCILKCEKSTDNSAVLASRSELKNVQSEFIFCNSKMPMEAASQIVGSPPLTYSTHVDAGAEIPRDAWSTSKRVLAMRSDSLGTSSVMLRYAFVGDRERARESPEGER